MSERREVSQDITEAERRDLVRRIALRGSRGRDLAEATVVPSQDFSAAAEAAIAADPVELSPVAMSDLGEMVNAPTADAARFAEAQREIFRRGQERELAAGQRYFDDARTVTEATNFALGEYEDDLRRLRDARSSGDGDGTFVPPVAAFALDPRVQAFENKAPDTLTIEQILNGADATLNADINNVNAGAFAFGPNDVSRVSFYDFEESIRSEAARNGVDFNTTLGLKEALREQLLPEWIDRGGYVGPEDRFFSPEGSAVQRLPAYLQRRPVVDRPGQGGLVPAGQQNRRPTTQNLPPTDR